MQSHRTTPAEFEALARNAFNRSQGTSVRKSVVSIGRCRHEFDLYQEGVIAGGVSTSPWTNKIAKHTNNSGGQDRVAAELLWLHLCDSAKRRVLILKENDMVEGIDHRFGRSGFFDPPVEVWVFDAARDTLTHRLDL
jgi:hypothetical protein